VDYEHLLVETVDGNIGLITLNRPGSLNAMNHAVMQGLDDALTSFEQDGSINCVVVTGKGEKAFSAGGDIHELVDTNPEKAGLLHKLVWHYATCRVPVIGALNGLAYGGAALLVSAFDIRIGCERTTFRYLYASKGRLSATWTLPTIVGWPKAKELLYTARVVQPDEALQMGLLNKLVPQANVLDEALEMARMIAANHPEAVQTHKRLLDADIGRGLHEMFDAEAEARRTRQVTPAAEAFKEFLERNPKAKAAAR
jgi:enoyl-CoA hydratase/carnithine racemase